MKAFLANSIVLAVYFLFKLHVIWLEKMAIWGRYKTTRTRFCSGFCSSLCYGLYGLFLCWGAQLGFNEGCLQGVLSNGGLPRVENWAAMQQGHSIWWQTEVWQGSTAPGAAVIYGAAAAMLIVVAWSVAIAVAAGFASPTPTRVVPRSVDTFTPYSPPAKATSDEE